MRSRKVPAFLEAFPDAHIDNFYTDSPKNDAPLIAMADMKRVPVVYVDTRKELGRLCGIEIGAAAAGRRRA